MQTEESVKAPFPNFGAVINYYNARNPARQRFVNIFEPDKHGGTYFKEFDRDSPDLKWSRIVLAMRDVLKWHRNECQAAWICCNTGDRTRQLNPVQLCPIFRVSPATMYRWLRKINDDMRVMFEKRGLIARETRPWEH